MLKRFVLLKTLPDQTKRDRGSVESKEAFGLPKFCGKEAAEKTTEL